MMRKVESRWVLCCCCLLEIPEHGVMGSMGVASAGLG